MTFTNSNKPAIQIEDLPCVKELSDAEAQQVTGGASWFVALANTMSRTVDRQARRLNQMSSSIANGGNNKNVSSIQTGAQKMQELASLISNSVNSLGDVSDTMAKKK